VERTSHRIKLEIRAYRLVLQDRRTPRLGKWLLGLAIGYAVSPIDLIPDFIPIVGQLDDVIIVPVLLWLALRLIPQDVLKECRQKAHQLS
jgi:uncharacterized membrane protein YkvA (DUF1232 family)